MSFSEFFPADQPQIVAALHLPALPGSRHPNAQPWQAIVDYTLRNAGYAVKAGVPALYIQDMGDYPWSPG